MYILNIITHTYYMDLHKQDLWNVIYLYSMLFSKKRYLLDMAKKVSAVNLMNILCSDFNMTVMLTY